MTTNQTIIPEQPAQATEPKAAQEVSVYQARLDARRQRLLERAEEARAQQASLLNKSIALTRNIPLGQPILRGHHSEGAHLRLIRQLHGLDGKVVEAGQRAVELERRAERVGEGGISSADPDALAQLRAQLAELEASQARMKAANLVLRKLRTEEERLQALLEMGIDGRSAGSVARFGKYTYHLTNNAANMRRIAARIAELEALASTEAVEIEGQGWRYVEDADEGRIVLTFSGKPDEETRQKLKSSGFRWAPSRGEWGRQRTGNGVAAGAAMVRYLQGKEAK